MIFKKLWALKQSTNLIFTVNQAVYNLFSLILIVITSKSLSVHDFGVFSYGYYLFPLFSIVQLSFIQIPLMNLFGKFEGDIAKYLFSNVVFSLIFGTLLSTILLILLCFLGINGRVSLMFSLFYFVFQLYEVVRRILLVKGKIIYVAIADFIRLLIPVILSVLIAIDNMLTVLFIGFLLLNAALIPTVGIKATKMYSIIHFLRENWNFGKWICATNVTQNISSNLYIYLGILILTSTEVASLNAPKVFLGLGSVIFLSMENIFTPRLTEKCRTYTGKLKGLIFWIIREYSFIYIGLFISISMVLIFQNEISFYLFDIPKGETTLWAYLAVIAVSALYRPILIVLRFVGLNKEIWKFSLAALIVTCIVTFPLMDSFGVNGAILILIFIPFYHLVAGVFLTIRYNGWFTN